ncbi:MAG: type IIL restriction-modification enzyme MmeI, partial [Aggregatilineales bacterium]
VDPQGTQFTFEKQVVKSDGRPGRADVWYKGRFAWEYKGKHKDLDAAYHQLLSYKTALENPPLLVVCDFDEYRIYPQWTNTSAEPFIFHNADLLQPRKLDYILWLLTDPNEFLEERKRELGERAAVVGVESGANTLSIQGNAVKWRPFFRIYTLGASYPHKSNCDTM